MAKINIPGLVIKRRGKITHHYWQPSATLKAAGWTSIPLGTDPRAAQKAAEAQNDKIAEWRGGGAAPRTVRKFLKGGTVDQLIARYIAERMPQAIARYRSGTWPEKDTILPLVASAASLTPSGSYSALGLKTQKEYLSKLRTIQRWAGTEQVSHIDRARVKKLREVLLRPVKGEVMINRAAGTMRVLKSLFEFAIDAGFLPEESRNPAANQNMPTPPPRDQIWSQAAIDAVTARAIADGQPGLALGIRLGRELGQREGDILKLVISRWAEIPRHKLNAGDWEALAEPGSNGALSVWGVRLRQGKTNRWVEVPLVGQTRRLMEQAIVEAKAHDTAVILQEIAIPREFRDSSQYERHLARAYHHDTGRFATDEQIAQLAQQGLQPRPWTETRFQRAIAQVRDQAAQQARAAGDDELADELGTLEYRDLRRTAVVSMGELGIEDQLIAAITGHKLDTTREILETYMPRTTKMAGRALALQQERTNVTPIGIDGKQRSS